MMNVNFSGALLRFVDFNKTVVVDAHSVRDAIAQVAHRFPAARPVLLDSNGEVREAHVVFLNGQQLSPGQFTAVRQAGDTVDLITPIAGG